MDHSEVTMGSATYEVSRIFTGSRTPADLLAERIVRDIEADPSFDGEERYGV